MHVKLPISHCLYLRMGEYPWFIVHSFLQQKRRVWLPGSWLLGCLLVVVRLQTLLVSIVLHLFFYFKKIQFFHEFIKAFIHLLYFWKCRFKTLTLKGRHQAFGFELSLSVSLVYTMAFLLVGFLIPDSENVLWWLFWFYFLVLTVGKRKYKY